MRYLIWVSTVCICPTKRTLGLYGVKYPDLKDFDSLVFTVFWLCFSNFCTFSFSVPPKLIFGETAFVASTGDSVTMPCRARGRPAPKVTWLKNGRSVASSNFYLRLLTSALAIPFTR